ncbi:ABC transporter permease [Actinoalloteichus hymeniacidonis]|uniref:ABC-type multidrug transport system, permease component n=1 Tax=Actinoalloteichus hymeniacidonis TaxID=340345 RepID=A0AAC9HRI3_9PSEU|nr:ABC transporter permease [Actinoalloteichus hymeniacidonis]AOS64013.1 ABC-type multidrug transport system, permease component [Actinoalloteichus hymeniacidonis]MBB5907925.1 ABC-2 type transport system permease protein [Actinoalloteichus hymeniacidonis]
MIGAATATAAIGFRTQLQQMRGNPDWFLALFTAPLTTVVFVSIFQAGGRADLTSYGILAPALIALWAMALQTAGELIARERENGSLELLVAAPASFGIVLAGRIMAVISVSLVAFVESWVVGWVMTGSPVLIAHPLVFAVTVLVTAFAMAGTATVMASLFVLARSARTFQNSLSYPFFLLGGVVVPVDLMPEPVRLLARFVFLSWSSDLLRDTLDPGPVVAVAFRVGMVLVLGTAGFLLGGLLLGRILRRVRTTGSLAHA